MSSRDMVPWPTAQQPRLLVKQRVPLAIRKRQREERYGANAPREAPAAHEAHGRPGRTPLEHRPTCHAGTAPAPTWAPGAQLPDEAAAFLLSVPDRLLESSFEVVLRSYPNIGRVLHQARQDHGVAVFAAGPGPFSAAAAAAATTPESYHGGGGGQPGFCPRCENDVPDPDYDCEKCGLELAVCRSCLAPTDLEFCPSCTFLQSRHQEAGK